MKIKIGLSVLLVFQFIGNIFAQYGFCSRAEYDQLLRTKTRVLLTANKQFDEDVKEGMKSYWKHTEYEFVTESQIDLTDTSYSYILPTNFEVTELSLIVKYPIYALMLGGKHATWKANDYVLAYAVTNPPDSQEKFIQYNGFRIKHMIRFLSDYITLVKEEKLKGYSTYFMEPPAAKNYNVNNARIKDKTLLVAKDFLAQNEQEEIEKNYPYKYKIIARSEIEKAIRENNKDYCYLLYLNSRFTFMYIIDTGTGEILYDTGSDGKYINYMKRLKKMNADLKKLEQPAKK